MTTDTAYHLAMHAKDMITTLRRQRWFYAASLSQDDVSIVKEMELSWAKLLAKYRNVIYNDTSDPKTRERQLYLTAVEPESTELK